MPILAVEGSGVFDEWFLQKGDWLREIQNRLNRAATNEEVKLFDQIIEDEKFRGQDVCEVFFSESSKLP